MIFTLLSGSTSTTITRSRPGTRSTTNASYSRKEWIPRPEQFSGVRSVPSSWTVQECAARITESSAGIYLVPRASATYQDGRGGPTSTMAGGSGSGRRRQDRRLMEAEVENGGGRGQQRQRPETAAVAVGDGGGGRRRRQLKAAVGVTSSGSSRRWQG